MTDSMIRIGVTGSGFMGRTHVEASKRAPGAEIVAVAGGRRAPGLADDYGIDCVASIEELIRRDDIDAIISSTPHHCHVDETLLAAECGKHVLVEKPMATSVADCDRMIAACVERGLVLAVGYHQRFRESNRTVRKLVASGTIGTVRCVQMAALFDIEALRSDEGFGGNWGWWTDPRSRAHIMNSGPHNIDLCRWWLGDDIVSVVASCGTFREADNPNENTTMAIWQFAGGAMASFWSSSVCPSPGFDGEDFRFRLMGDEGIIDANPFGKIRVGRDGEWTLAYEQPHVPLDDADAAFVSDGRMQAYTDQVQAFVDRIHGLESGCGTEIDGRVAVAAIEGMLDSSTNGTVIRMDGSP